MSTGSLTIIELEKSAPKYELPFDCPRRPVRLCSGSYSTRLLDSNYKFICFISPRSFYGLREEGLKDDS
jgi:hypothetical protein